MVMWPEMVNRRVEKTVEPNVSVQVAIYNSNGDLIRLLKLGELPPGSYLSTDRASYWDGRDQKGYPVASGVYFYQLQSIGNSRDPSFHAITTPRKMMIIK